jgi:hypothetical protein
MVNMCVLLSLEQLTELRQVCEPYIIMKETDAKLKRWSKFRLLRFEHIIGNDGYAWYRPARLDLHESGTIGKHFKRTSTAVYF